MSFVDDRPRFVAISGFGGSGKSTLVSEISSDLSLDSCVVPVDDFIVGSRTERSADWNTFDRARLLHDVIQPARVGSRLQYQSYSSGE